MGSEMMISGSSLRFHLTGKDDTGVVRSLRTPRDMRWEDVPKRSDVGRDGLSRDP